MTILVKFLLETLAQPDLKGQLPLLPPGACLQLIKACFAQYDLVVGCLLWRKILMWSIFWGPHWPGYSTAQLSVEYEELRRVQHGLALPSESASKWKIGAPSLLNFKLHWKLPRPFVQC